jgi:hypothetical protein
MSEEATEEMREERGEHHFAKEDLWDFYTHNAEAQVYALTWFRDHGTGHPACMTAEEWKAILQTMINGFQAILDAEYNDWTPEVGTMFEAGMRVYTEWYFHLWD